MYHPILMLIVGLFMWVLFGMNLLKQLHKMLHENGALRMLQRALTVSLCLIGVTVGATLMHVAIDLPLDSDNQPMQMDAVMACPKPAQPSLLGWLLPPSS